MNKLRWLRVIGDTIFATGTIALALFIAGLKLGFSLKKESDLSPEHYPSVREQENPVG